ncbi:MAG: hypothetical protein DMD35_02400 [Gemmatimonadetes bacterium]|nr:MAG: hypothetical protein DMD35_02400 [Gemmatimonadota bacterium]
MHQTYPTSRDPHGERTFPTIARRLRAIFGVAVLASILTATAGCDKNAETAEVVHRTSLANKPNVVFLLFGDRSDPRILPVATTIEGQVAPVSLDVQGWRDFDHIYFRPGTSLSLYRDGRSDGEGKIRRGMWDATGPLYKLPRCRSVKPLAALVPRKFESSDVMLERIATSEPLAPAPDRGPVPRSAIDTARAIALKVSQHEGITRNARAGLDLAVFAIHTGATRAPTLVASYIERGGGIQGHPRHLFVLADSTAGGYAPTFVHSADDSLPEFRRYIDHADITGDGVDELLLEGWENGGDSFLLFLRYTNGKWREMARGETSWCADPKRKA